MYNPKRVTLISYHIILIQYLTPTKVPIKEIQTFQAARFA